MFRGYVQILAPYSTRSSVPSPGKSSANICNRYRIFGTRTLHRLSMHRRRGTFARAAFGTGRHSRGSLRHAWFQVLAASLTLKTLLERHRGFRG